MQTTRLATPKYAIECRKHLFRDNFADGAADSADWSEDAGNWVVEKKTQWDGDEGYIYSQDNTAASRVAATKSLSTWTDYYAVCAFKIVTASGSVGIVFRKSSSEYYSFKVTQGSSNNLKLEKEDGTQIGSFASATIAQNTWYMARIRCDGTSIACDISTDFINFTEYIDETDSSYSEGGTGVKTYSTSAEFDSVEAYELKKRITESDNDSFMGFNIKGTTSSQADVFDMGLRNASGANTALFQEGYEIHVWAGYAENTPSLVKMFVGQIENSTPGLADSSGDTLSVSGSDWIVELLSQPVTEVYYNKTVDWVFKDLVSKYCENVTAGVNVASTLNTLERIAFKHKPLFECLVELALEGDGTNEFDFWIDLKQDLHFEKKGTTDSGKTLTAGDNILSQDFGKSLEGVYNIIRVFGKGKPDENNVVEQTTEDEDYSFGKSTTYQKVAQTFKLEKPQMFDFVIKPAASAGTPNTDIVFELQETSSGLPSGKVLATYILKNEEWTQDFGGLEHDDNFDDDNFNTNYWTELSGLGSGSISSTEQNQRLEFNMAADSSFLFYRGTGFTSQEFDLNLTRSDDDGGKVRYTYLGFYIDDNNHVDFQCVNDKTGNLNRYKILKTVGGSETEVYSSGDQTHGKNVMLKIERNATTWKISWSINGGSTWSDSGNQTISDSVFDGEGKALIGSGGGFGTEWKENYLDNYSLNFEPFFEEVTVPLDADLDPNETYAVVMYSKENVLSDVDYFKVRDNSAAGYADGQVAYYDGTNWTAVSGKDLYFKAFPRLPNVIEKENFELSQEHSLHRTYEDTEKIEEIRNYEECKKRAEYIYSKKTTIPYEGNITALGMDDVRAGQKIGVVISNSSVNDSYEIIEITHTLDKENGFTSTVYLNTRLETIIDVVAEHEKRIRNLEVRDITEDERITQIKSLTETLETVNDPSNNLEMVDREMNSSGTWNFALDTTCAFDLPLPFDGGGSGKYGTNRIADASA